MTKRKVNAKEILQDIIAGMSNTALVEKCKCKALEKKRRIICDKKVLFTVVVACLVLASSSWAARRIEKREEATHVVTGKVGALYFEKKQREEQRLLGVIVELGIDTVEKGDGLKKGDWIHVLFYERNPSYRVPSGALPTPGESRGHSYVPQKGEIVRLFLRGHQGNYSAIWPDGVDVLGKDKPR